MAASRVRLTRTEVRRFAAFAPGYDEAALWVRVGELIVKATTGVESEVERGKIAVAVQARVRAAVDAERNRIRGLMAGKRGVTPTPAEIRRRRLALNGILQTVAAAKAKPPRRHRPPVATRRPSIRNVRPRRQACRGRIRTRAPAAQDAEPSPPHRRLTSGAA